MIKSILRKSLYTIIAVISFNSNAQNKILFDATKAEMCSNADWVIDADAHNIYFSSSTHLPYTSSAGGQSNPQRTPSPAQSGITNTTTETYWDGCLSAWAVDCVKQGYIVESLPYNMPITYGTSAVQDLSNYKVFVVDEPNMLFSATEKTALMNFVANGGGLIMIADHSGSDRNFDTYDSPMIWNDLMNNNSILNNAFGITFDLIDTNNITSTTFPNLPTNPILHGSYGNVTQVKFYSGTTITINPANNSTAKGLVYTTGSNTTGNTNALVASASYLSGKVVAIGDSSMPDDGTGDPNDINLYDGYTTNASGNHRKLLMNAVVWLMTSTLNNNENVFDATHFSIAPNPTKNKQLNFSFSLDKIQDSSITIFDSLGRIVKEQELKNLTSGVNYQTIDASDLQSGMYVIKLSNSFGSKNLKVVLE